MWKGLLSWDFKKHRPYSKKKQLEYVRLTTNPLLSCLNNLVHWDSGWIIPPGILGLPESHWPSFSKGILRPSSKVSLLLRSPLSNSDLENAHPNNKPFFLGGEVYSTCIWGALSMQKIGEWNTYLLSLITKYYTKKILSWATLVLHWVFTRWAHNRISPTNGLRNG